MEQERAWQLLKFMAYDWMNAGPGPLDLLTPLAEGEKQGTQEAYRQDQIKAEAAKESDMRSRLGLEQEAQQFQQNVFAAGSGLRQAQLSEANARATMLTNTADQTIAGAPELADRMHTLNLANTPDDIDALPTALENGTETQQQQYQQALNAKKTGLAYQIHAKTATDQALNEATAIQQFAANGGQVTTFDGKVVPVDQNYLLNGQPDLGKIGDFNRTASLKTAQAQENIKTQSAISVNDAKQSSIADRMIDVNKAKVRDTSAWAPGDTVAYKAAAVSADTALNSMSKLFPGDPHYDFFQQQYSDAHRKMQEIESSYPGAAAQSAPSASGVTATSSISDQPLTTAAQVQALPSGSIYTWTDGKKYRKN